MYTNDRNAYRQAFFTTWEKHLRQLPMEAVETQLLEVIQLHPEYHDILTKPHTYKNQEFDIAENPFFHMSLHVTLFEQIRMNKPSGIRELYLKAEIENEDKHFLLHCMMATLTEMLAAGAKTGEMPSDQQYLDALKKISERT